MGYGTFLPRMLMPLPLTVSCST